MFDSDGAAVSPYVTVTLRNCEQIADCSGRDTHTVPSAPHISHGKLELCRPSGGGSGGDDSGSTQPQHQTARQQIDAVAAAKESSARPAIRSGLSSGSGSGSTGSKELHVASAPRAPAVPDAFSPVFSLQKRTQRQ